MSNRVFSGLGELPCGMASEEVTEGCMVLESGAFRGLYGEGALDALMEEGINLSCTIGTSAGAMSGSNYVSGQIGRSARINLGYRHDRRYISWVDIFKNGGPINFDFAFYHVPGDLLDAPRFFDTKKRFIAVATNCITGRPVYFDRDSCGDIFQAIRASASMPYMSRIVLVDGIPCLDGGCSTKTPFRWAVKQGYKKIVIIQNRPRGFRYEDEKPSKMAKIYYHGYPRFAETLASSHLRTNRDYDEIDRLEAEGKIFVIAPTKPVTAGKMEPDMEKLGALYYMGYEDAKNAAKDLRSYLAGD